MQRNQSTVMDLYPVVQESDVHETQQAVMRILGIAIAEGSNLKQRLICKEGMHTGVVLGPATLVFRYSAWPERLLAILPVQCLA